VSLDITSKEKPVGNFLSSLLEAYPDATMRDIAVLFTDVVGSTTFFKTHGDIRGREMLRTHHRMAMSVIETYGGRLIKEVGDSVLVYFPATVDALNASIKIQQKFFLHNMESIDEDQIHVRIGLHHGRVIVEDKDIYGDVVNVAAKLTNLARGDQVFVSHEIYEATKHLPSIQFEGIDFWKMQKVPDGLKIYKVIWEHAFAAPPSKKVFAIVVHDPVRSSFRVTEDDINTPAGGITDGPQMPYISLNRTPGNDLAVVYDTIHGAVHASRAILSHLLQHHPSEKAPLPVKIYVRCASILDEKTILSRGAGDELNGAAFGGIYITPEVFHYMNNYYRISGETVLGFEEAGNVYAVLDGQKEVNAPPVPGQPAPGPAAATDAMMCFYCGSGRHTASSCPSKGLAETGRALGRLGYFSIHSIEELARRIQNPPEDIKVSPQAFSVESQLTKHELTAHAFYDLTRAYQLRFHQTVWNTNAKTWETMPTAIIENQGGFAWLAQDSLRVGSFDKARSFVNLALERKPRDFKAWCISGFLNIENGNNTAACSDFETALECADAGVPKTYVSLMLSRLYKFTGDRERFREMLSAILASDPTCREAQYEDTIVRFSDNSEKPAIQRLVRLIRDHRDYFVIALIDPELNAWRNVIYPHVFEMLLEVKKEAVAHFEDAKREIAKIRSLLSRETLETTDPLLAEIERLVQSESYAACLDVPSKCSSVRIMCKNALNEQVHMITDNIRTLQFRLEKADEFLASYRYPYFLQKYERQLAYLKTSLRGVGDVRIFESSAEFQKCYDTCQEISRELSSLENSMEYLEVTAQMIGMGWKFLKHSSFFFSIVFFLGVFIFPLISDPLNGIAARFDISLFPNSWSLQKSLLIFGGILSLIASFLISIKEAFRQK
jgi:class 3 adenylate cyclase